jgi:hypothetical protein
MARARERRRRHGSIAVIVPISDPRGILAHFVTKLVWTAPANARFVAQLERRKPPLDEKGSSACKIAAEAALATCVRNRGQADASGLARWKIRT